MKASKEEIKVLIEKYYDADTSLEEEQVLFRYFNSGAIAPELTGYAEEFKAFAGYPQHLKAPRYVVEKILGFSHQQSLEQRRSTPYMSPTRYLLVAAVVVFMAVSFLLDFFQGDHQSNIAQRDRDQIYQLKAEKREMKTLMINNFLEQQHNHQKLYALNLASQLDSIQGETLDLVWTTLKKDKNVNIRLAAADVLYQFASYERVEHTLAEAISKQESPLVIISLLRIIKSLKPEHAQALMEKIMQEQNLQDSLKQDIQSMYKAI